ncbi:tail protein [Staphylococcus phage phi44AHJD]|uniref:Tail protein n=1 Tax=Staphylococcus phage 44AHJD TaxID=204086 RepID=Q859L1_BP44A|nr:tail protein [Staphylococcus phage phi44AHJD]AAO83866.1 tail protein [Staphylococcus phage phi44AHJD]WOZ17247.1 tail fiber [Staphylococcus phage vB_SauP-V4SA02]
MRKLTNFKFFYNTPFTDYQNTIHFNSNKERDDYFLNGRHFKSLDYSKQPYNFIRDRMEINVDMQWHDAQGINYMTFLSDFEDRRYYAFVNQIEYVNDVVVKIYFVIDTIMTYTQGNVLEQLSNVNIERQHLSKRTYNYMLPMLRNNDDVLKVSNKNYVYNQMQQYLENLVLFQSSADLSKKFGTKKEPNLDTSKGTIYDNITSPVNLYVMEYGDFINFMDKMSAYPWITQNFQKVQMLPKDFINTKDLEDVKTSEKITGLKTLKQGGKSKEWSLKDLSLSFSNLQEMMLSKKDEFKHMIRNEYMTIEFYDWNGNTMLLDAGKISQKTGVKLRTKSIIGYHNEVRVYPVDYNSAENDRPILAKNKEILIDTGSFLNTNITFNSFAQVPILINNGILGQSQQANRQKNAESQLITNRIDNVLNGSDPKSRFYDAVSVASNLSPTALFGKFNEEYNFYKQQQAEYKDLALQPPSVTESEMGNAFQIANSINGLTMKISVPSPKEITFLQKYYMLFGFEVNDYNSFIEPINSMTVCNYLKCTGTYTIRDIDPMLMEQLKAILESGVRFWHNDGSGNPMLQNPLNNKFREGV